MGKTILSCGFSPRIAMRPISTLGPCLPLWTTFYLSLPMLAAAPPALLALQVACTLAFGYAAVWLFRNIRLENRGRRWFRWLFQGKEWTPMVKAMEMLGELGEEG
jgi:hypothetical protein